MKYMGSKSRIAKQIVPIIQDKIRNRSYYEPFCGGCNVIDKIAAPNKFAYDLDKYLIALLVHVQRGGGIPNSISKEEYDKYRIAWRIGSSEYPDWLIGAAAYLASFNGRGFDGGYAKPGYDNGRFRDYYQEAKANLLKQASNPLFQDIEFSCQDYKSLQVSNAMIYCDPPYANTKQFNNSKNFDHAEFWNVMRRWSKNNIVLISELAAPEDFECIWQQDVSRSIKPNAKTRAVEKIFIFKGIL